ncbi:hypothetical protein evm_014122 [Chilo suppressalis]|nr:hypothetical protein evm_014122 [Chilo suppressalis]
MMGSRRNRGQSPKIVCSYVWCFCYVITSYSGICFRVTTSDGAVLMMKLQYSSTVRSLKAVLQLVDGNYLVVCRANMLLVRYA